MQLLSLVVLGVRSDQRRGTGPTSTKLCLTFLRVSTLPANERILKAQSGAEGSRTPDLRRAKSRYYYRPRSPLFKIACKIALLPLAAFACVRRRSCGLVYYWCKQTLDITSLPAHLCTTQACLARPARSSCDRQVICYYPIQSNGGGPRLIVCAEQLAGEGSRSTRQSRRWRAAVGMLAGAVATTRAN